MPKWFFLYNKKDWTSCASAYLKKLYQFWRLKKNSIVDITWMLTTFKRDGNQIERVYFWLIEY